MKNVKLYCGDNADTLRKFKPNSIDLTVTSPPYDDLRDYNGYIWDFETLTNQLFRVTKDGGVVVWVVNDATVDGSETGTSFRQALYFMEVGFKLHDTMIWLKPHFSNPATNRCHQVFEYMFILSKGKPKTFKPILDHKNKWTKALGKSSRRNKDGTMLEKKDVTYGEYSGRTNVWKINTVSQEAMFQKPMHPAAFSEQLAHDHIISWSNVGDVVLDPFMGSGTTGKMALHLERKFVGVELSQEYYDIAKKRIEDVPRKLF